MRRRTILVTGTGGRSVGCGIVYALTRAAGADRLRESWEVIAADADPYAFGLYKADRRVILPFARDPSYLSRLREIIEKYEVAAVIPGTETEASLLARESQSLRPAIVVANRPELMGLMNDKRELAARLAELKIATPASECAIHWRQFIKGRQFPFIIKPATSTGGSRGVRIVTDEAMLATMECHLGGQLAGFILQEYVGDKNSEFTVGVLTDQEGCLIDSIVIQRKLAGLSLLESAVVDGSEYVISTGYSQGFIVTHSAIQAFCEDLALRLGSRGPLNIQLRLHGDKPVVFEVHPRFSGTTPIRADAGFNEPDILLRNNLNGEQFQRLHHKTDVAVMRAFEHVLVPRADYEQLGGEFPRGS